MSQTQTVTTTWRPGANDTFEEEEEENPLYVTANLDATGTDVSESETVVVEDVGPDHGADQIADDLETLDSSEPIWGK